MGLAAFNRMRREQAEREAAELAELARKQVDSINVQEEEKEPAKDENEGLTIDEVKAELDELGIKYAHNTSEKKLRGKLKEAIG